MRLIISEPDTANRRKRTINPLPVQPARPRPIKHQPAVRDRRAAGLSRVHRFKDSLALSERFVDADWWEPLYKRAFPTLASAVAVREDGWAQRGGIDRLLTLSCGRTYTVDEKIRTEDWPDVLLERWSNERARSPGWVQKPLACDFIAYAYAPAATCVLLPVPSLQRAWRQHGRQWIVLAIRRDLHQRL